MSAISKIDKTKFLVWLLEGTRRRNGLRDVRTIHNFTQLIEFPATEQDIQTVRNALERITQNPIYVNSLQLDSPQIQDIFSKAADRIRNGKPLNKLKGTFYEKTLAALQRARMESSSTGSRRELNIAEELERVLKGNETDAAKIRQITTILRKISEGGKPQGEKEQEIAAAINAGELQWTVSEFLEKKRRESEELKRTIGRKIGEGERRMGEVMRRRDEADYRFYERVERTNPDYFEKTNPLLNKGKPKKPKKKGGGGTTPPSSPRQYRILPVGMGRRPYGRRR